VSEADDRKLWARPVVRVTNLARSLAYYCEKLGFVTDWDEGGPESAIAQVSRGGFALILDRNTYFPKAAVPSVISLTLHDGPQRPGLADLHRALVSAGANVTKAPFKVHWDPHVYELNVEDPDGNVLMFWGHMPASDSRHETGVGREQA
jgi:catechol 2,3-dioxygenase-like lactoylglutathione lyase family enzyme